MKSFGNTSPLFFGQVVSYIDRGLSALDGRRKVNGMMECSTRLLVVHSAALVMRPPLTIFKKTDHAVSPGWIFSRKPRVVLIIYVTSIHGEWHIYTLTHFPGRMTLTLFPTGDCSDRRGHAFRARGHVHHKVYLALVAGPEQDLRDNSVCCQGNSSSVYANWLSESSWRLGVSLRCVMNDAAPKDMN